MLGITGTWNAPVAQITLLASNSPLEVLMKKLFSLYLSTCKTFIFSITGALIFFANSSKYSTTLSLDAKLSWFSSANSKVGNFVEIKKSNIGKKSKVNHLAYIGDTNIGKSVNIGAGTITCNYDGIKKNKTKIKRNVFVGSNSSLVAPLVIEENSVIGAGSVITKNIKKNSLALTRSPQITKKNYKRKKK